MIEDELNMVTEIGLWLLENSIGLWRGPYLKNEGTHLDILNAFPYSATLSPITSYESNNGRFTFGDLTYVFENDMDYIAFKLRWDNG